MVLTKHLKAQHTSVCCPIYIFTVRTIPDQLAATWNVPCNKKKKKVNHELRHVTLDLYTWSLKILKLMEVVAKWILKPTWNCNVETKIHHYHYSRHLKLCLVSKSHIYFSFPFSDLCTSRNISLQFGPLLYKMP